MESKVLLLLIMRSQKELTMTAGKFIDLSLEGFTSVRILKLFSLMIAVIWL